LEGRCGDGYWGEGGKGPGKRGGRRKERKRGLPKGWDLILESWLRGRLGMKYCHKPLKERKGGRGGTDEHDGNSKGWRFIWFALLID